MAVELSRKTREAAVRSIMTYSEENLDEPLRQLAAGLLLDFFLEEIGPSIYNKAVRDAQDHLTLRIGDLDVDVHEEEFQYSRENGWRVDL